jgi:hypothetical protein
MTDVAWSRKINKLVPALEDAENSVILPKFIHHVLRRGCISLEIAEIVVRTLSGSSFEGTWGFITYTLSFKLSHKQMKSRDGSVDVALGCGLDDRGSRVRFPAGAGNFSPHHRVHNGSGAHPASYLMGTRCSFPGGEAAGE